MKTARQNERFAEISCCDRSGFGWSGWMMLRAIKAVEHSELEHNVLDDRTDPVRDQVAISTMHLAKGLEFRAVVVMACDEDVIPLQERIETVTDEADLEEVYNTERHLLYVACTRARDQLLVTGVDPGSEFLEDLQAKGEVKRLSPE